MVRPAFRPHLRLPVWPLASSKAAVYGMHSASGAPTCSTRLTLRSPTDFLAMHLAIRFQIHADLLYSVTTCLTDVYSADPQDWTTLGRYLTWADKRVKAVLGTCVYPRQRDLHSVLEALLNSLTIREVVEYRGIGQADIVRPLTTADVAAMTRILVDLRYRDPVSNNDASPVSAPVQEAA